MGGYAQLDRSAWNKPWFQSLSDKNFRLYLFLFSNESCQASGIYEMSAETISFYSKIPLAQIHKHMSELHPHVLWEPRRGLVLVQGHFKRACRNGDYARSAFEQVRENYPELLNAWASYPRTNKLLKKHGITYEVPNSHPIAPYEVPMGGESVQDKTRLEEKKTLPHPAAAGPGPEELFNEFWKAYPRKRGKKKAFTRYQTALKRASPEVLLLGAKNYALEVYGKSEEFVKWPEGWLAADRWQEHQELSHDARINEEVRDLLAGDEEDDTGGGQLDGARKSQESGGY